MLNKYRHIIYSLIGALLITAIAGSGLLQRPDRWVSDSLFQTNQMLSGDIVIIGIDDATLAEFGPYHNWDRNIMASALEVLGSDEANKPAVVAVDTLYTGRTNDEADTRLANAAKNINLITATAAEFGTVAIYGDEGFSGNTSTVVGYNEPYEELRSVTTQGHINAMYDLDGILRHALLYVSPSNGEKVYSMAYMTAKKFLETKGETITEPVTNPLGHFYVPMSSLPGGYYDGVSLSKLIKGEVPADYYAGKIVLIGPYSIGLQDAYFTAIDRSKQMYGVEFQANVIQSLLDRNFKEEASDFPQLVILFLVCSLMMMLFFNRKILISGLVTALVIILDIGGCYVLYEQGLVTHPLWIPFGVLLIFIALVIFHYVKAAMERAEVTKTFERYVAPSIVNEIMKEGTDNLSLGGKNCEIAVLFVDVRGFTTMSERLSPEKVVFILNRYLTMASGCIENHSGTLDKYVGDAVMAFWGAPLPQEDSVYLACQTALDIIKGAEEVSAQLKEEIGEEFRVGVGVHYGPAVVGNMGSERRMDYTAIGDTVNTAARLEANAPGSTCYISRIVADKLGERGTYTSLGDTIKLKGKADGFEVLTLDSLDGGDKADA